MNIFEEELLEPVARLYRFKKGLTYLPKSKAITIADLGCGPKIRFYHFAKRAGLNIKEYIGIDPLIHEGVKNEFNNNESVKLIHPSMNKQIPLQNNSVDVVTGFAFLEHVDHPKEIISDSLRVLKPGGRAIFTTPTPVAKTILEFLSFKLGLISPREIKEHKNYFDKNSLKLLLSNDKYKVRLEHKYFEAGLNNILIIYKLS